MTTTHMFNLLSQQLHITPLQFLYITSYILSKQPSIRPKHIGMPPNQPLTIPTLLHLITFIITIIILNPSIKAQHSPPPTQNYGSPLPTNAIIIVIVVCSVGLITCYVRQFTACCGAYLFSAAESATEDQGVVRRRENPRTGGGGLDPAILASIPTYSFSDVKNLIKKTAVLECAVCLNEFVDQELLRLLPGCCHVFHPHCIGRWLASHVTCPVCRANLEIQVDNRNHDQVIQQLNEDNELEPSDQITQDHHHQHDVIIDIVEPPEISTKSPEVHVSKGVGERRGKFPRSHSTGHSLLENNERFTLRLPDEVRNKLVNVTNLTGLPAAIVSPRTGYRFKKRSTSLTMIPGKPDQWRFTMSPPFISRSGSSDTEEYLNNNNNSSSNIMGLVKSPKSLLKSRKSPLNRVSRCDDIGERSSDKLWPNNTNS